MDREEVIAIATQSHRVCPQPQQWEKMYKLLPDRVRHGSGWNPALPLILGAWNESSDLEKIARFQTHIDWADSKGVIDLVGSYLLTLSESQWHHFGD